MNKLRYPLITHDHDLLITAYKVREEAQELIDAIESGESRDRILEEFCDTEQATETLTVRAYREFGRVRVTSWRFLVIDKNRRRGYYGE